MPRNLTLSLLLVSVLGLTACGTLTMPSAQVPFPDVTKETRPCQRKMEASGTITPDVAAELAVTNGQRLEDCADQVDALAKIIADYLKEVAK